MKPHDEQVDVQTTTEEDSMGRVTLTAESSKSWSMRL